MAQRNITWASSDGRTFATEAEADRWDAAKALYSSAMICSTTSEFIIWLDKNRPALLEFLGDRK